MARTVLLVDADRDVCEIAARALTREGFRTKVEGDTDSALARIERGGIGLVIADLLLPGRDGFALLEGIRSLAVPVCETPVVLSSSCRFTPEYMERAKALGAKALLVKPIALDRFTKYAERYSKEMPPAVVRPAESGSHEAFEAPMSGRLRDVPIPKLLHSLHGLRANGVLMLTNGDKRKAIQVRDGYPVAVKSNLVGECLGQLLMAKGLIGRAEYDESFARAQRGKGLHGEVLVAMQLLDEEQLSQALSDQAEEKLLEIFEWRGGRFKFEIGGRLKRGHALALDRSPASVILEGVRTRFPIERIDSYLDEHRSRYIAPSEAPFYRLQELDSGDDVAALLERLGDSPRLGAVRGLPEADRRILYALLLTGFLELRSRRPGRDVGADESVSVPVGVTDSKRGAERPSREEERALRAELAAMAERQRRQSFFEILEVATDATNDEISEAFDFRARSAHPDRYVHASSSVRQLADKVFDRLSLARETLLDPTRRSEYKRKLEQGERRAEQDKKALEAEVEFQRGESNIRQRSFQAALLCFGNALQRAPDEGEYHAHYGWALYLAHPQESAMVEEAIEHVRRGLKLAPDREKPYLFLGRIYKATGRETAAEKIFTRAVELSPNSVDALRELRLITMRREKNKGLIGRILRR